MTFYITILFNVRNREKESAISVYQDRFNISLKKSDFASASGAYHSLKKIDPKFENAYKEIIDQMYDLYENEEAFGYKYVIKESSNSSIHLWKRKLSFYDVENGMIQNIKLRCESKFKELPFQTETLYEIPKKWGHCRIELVGDTGARVTMIQG